MTQLHGKNLIAGEASASGAATFRGIAPVSGGPLEPAFVEATPAEVDRAATLAEDCLESSPELPPSQIAALLEKIAAEIETIGDVLIERAVAETALSADRLVGERGRTANQLRIFAGLVREGSWKDIRIDRALPDRKPIGPVAVWAASN